MLEGRKKEGKEEKDKPLFCRFGRRALNQKGSFGGEEHHFPIIFCFVLFGEEGNLVLSRKRGGENLVFSTPNFKNREEIYHLQTWKQIRKKESMHKKITKKNN